MKELLHKIIIYLNENTTIRSTKRYKTIIGFLLTQVCCLFPIYLSIYFTNRDIISPIIHRKNTLLIDYNDVFLPLSVVMICIFWMWMTSLNFAVAAFCSERWTKYCIENKRPYFNHIFYPIFKEYYRQVKLDWFFALIFFIFCTILMRSPQNFQVNVDTKIMNYYGYTFCSSYVYSGTDTLKLIYALDVSKCP